MALLNYLGGDGCYPPLLLRYIVWEVRGANPPLIVLSIIIIYYLQLVFSIYQYYRADSKDRAAYAYPLQG